LPVPVVPSANASRTSSGESSNAAVATRNCTPTTVRVCATRSCSSRGDPPVAPPRPGRPASSSRFVLEPAQVGGDLALPPAASCGGPHRRPSTKANQRTSAPVAPSTRCVSSLPTVQSQLACEQELDEADAHRPRQQWASTGGRSPPPCSRRRRWAMPNRRRSEPPSGRRSPSRRSAGSTATGQRRRASTRSARHSAQRHGTGIVDPAAGQQCARQHADEGGTVPETAFIAGSSLGGW